MNVNKWLNRKVDDCIYNKHIVRELYIQFLDFLEKNEFKVIDYDILKNNFYILIYNNSN